MEAEWKYSNGKPELHDRYKLDWSLIDIDKQKRKSSMANAMRFYISWFVLVFVHIWIFWVIPRSSFLCKFKINTEN